MKKLVGVMPLWDEQRESEWMLPGYLEGLRQAGALPFIFPLTSDEGELRQLCSLCHGFLFTGGQDVSPSLYGEEPLPELGECCPARDEMDALVLKIALEEEKPILGICRGIQFINAALGGTLYQDLATLHPSHVGHRQSPPYDVPSHEVRLLPGTPLEKCLGKKTAQVNSCHHQAVKDLAKGLLPMAFSPDGLIEGLYKPGYPFLWALQWHPEFSYRKDEDSRKIFSAFADALEET